MKIQWKPPTTGVITRLTVYLDGKQVGQGYMLEFEDWYYRPMLVGNDGEVLEPGWFSLKTEERQLCVVTRTIQ